MSQYLLKKSGSNEIESIFEWDGVGNLTSPIGYEFEILVDSGSQFISYTASLLDSSSIETADSIFVGTHRGTFSGDILGATFFGNTLESLLNSTQYGTFEKISSDNEPYLIALTQSCFQVIDESTILLSGVNISTPYSKSFAEIVNNNIENYRLTFKSSNIPPKKVEYLVKNTEFISTGEYGFYTLNVRGITEDSNTFKNETRENDKWHIDLDFNSFENTGSFTGSFEGYAELTGSFLGAFEGLLDGTASNSVYALTASFAQNASSIEVIGKSKNWTKPSWAKTVRVTCVGGGGGGGAAPALEDTMSLTIGGGGGGGGTITVGEFDADTLPDIISITVGAGGFGGIHDGVSLIGPSNGGDTYFGRYLIARGGNRGFNGGTEIAYACGGSTIANIHYLNTGAGGGGAGTVDGYIGSPLFITDASEAPSLPLPNKYLAGSTAPTYYVVTPTPIPSVIAPTGGGGGLGYDFQNGGRQDGITKGGSISAYGLTNQDNRFKSLSPFEYSSGSYEIIDSESIDLGTYPAYNTTVGLGGRGGNPYYIDIDLSSAMPTDGTIYGGGGGGAFGGGIDGRYINGEINGTPYNFGANGAQGVVVIISEA